MVRGSQGQLWAADQGRAVALRNGKETRVFERRPSNKTDRPGPLLPGRNGGLWFLGETIRSLTTGVEFRDRQIYVADMEQKLSVFDRLARKIDVFVRIINARFQYKRLRIDETWLGSDYATAAG